MKLKLFTIAVVIMLFVDCGLAQTGTNSPNLQSKWDANLPNIELGNVSIKVDPDNGFYEPTIARAWEQITSKYLLRANIYVDLKTATNTEKRSFTFKKENATGNELFDAFLATYPEYTYTHDPKTGVIWFHAKNINYDDILNNKVKIKHPVLQVPMLRGVLEPLFDLVRPNPKFHIDPTGGEAFSGNLDAFIDQFNMPVDLPAGVYSVRDILNFCCVASPNLVFFGFDEYGNYGNGAVTMLVPSYLYYDNPLALERPGAISFWGAEIGDTTNTPPSPKAITAAMSDANPRKRWAARQYCEATPRLSQGSESSNVKMAVWQFFGWNAVISRGVWYHPFLTNVPVLFQGKKPAALLGDLLHEDPGLALVTSMELARETKNTGNMDVVSGHKFTESEIAEVKPDVYLIARQSKLVRDKLLAMKFDVPELSAAALTELADTNLFTLVPAEEK